MPPPIGAPRRSGRLSISKDIGEWSIVRGPLEACPRYIIIIIIYIMQSCSYIESPNIYLKLAQKIQFPIFQSI